MKLAIWREVGGTNLLQFFELLDGGKASRLVYLHQPSAPELMGNFKLFFNDVVQLDNYPNGFGPTFGDARLRSPDFKEGNDYAYDR